MIVLLLNYSLSWCQNKEDTIPFTGEVLQADSILVPVDYIKVANAKMIELKYEKQLNDSYKVVIENDSIFIDKLYTNLLSCEYSYNSKIEEIKKIKKQRNIAIETGCCTTLLFLILFIISL